MNRDKAFLLDIYNAINRIVLFSKDLTKSDLKSNEEKTIRYPLSSNYYW